MIQKNEVLIAGRALWEFDARMVAFPEITTDVDCAVFQGLERSSIQLLHLRQAGMHMGCEIDYFGSLQEREAHRSALEAILITATEPVIIDYGDGYFYRAVLEKAPEVTAKNDVFTEAVYRFRVTKHTPQVLLEIIASDFVEGQFSLYCQSNVPLTDCLVAIPAADISNAPSPSFRLNDQSWYFNDLEITGGIVLDGISKIFKMGGDNITNHEEFTWTTFPALKPGLNTLSLYSEGFPINSFSKPILLDYTPTYL